MKVQVKGIGVKLAGKWCYKGDIAEITEEEYSENEKYLIVLEGATPKKTEQKTQKKDEEDTELKVLREKAKELGIRGANMMKKETLEAKIAEMEKKIENPDDEEDPGENPGENEEGKENPDGE